MAKQTSVVERLKKEGLIQPDDLTAEHLEVLNSLTMEEVDMLLKLKRKMKHRGPLPHGPLGFPF